MDAINRTTLEHMDVIDKAVDHVFGSSLAPPIRLEPGCIVTLRMRGHVRTAGLEYFAPAVVLAQHMPNGEIEVLVWDSTAGTHYNPSYPVRDLSSRGDGSTRELYEVQSNIGKVLFSPDQFAAIITQFSDLFDFTHGHVRDLYSRVEALEQVLTATGPGAPVTATPLDSPNEAQPRSKKT